jgi:hypothetical protein
MSTPALELRLTGQQTTYKLDLGSRTPVEVRQHIEQVQEQLTGDWRLRGDPPFPGPPAVDLQLEIHNHGTQDTVIWWGGSDTSFLLELVGPGALCFSTGRAVVAMWTPSSPIKLPAGGQHVLPLRQLSDGCFLNCYWTEPGRYTLTVRLQLGAEVQGTTGPVLVSNPIILDVQ